MSMVAGTNASEIAHQDVLSQEDEIRSLKKQIFELENFIEEANIPTHKVGPDGIILWANNAELEYMGYLPDEYIGRHIAEFHADQAAIENILEKLASGKKLEGYPARMIKKNGEIRDVEIFSSVRFEEDKFMHTRCFTYDVTQHKRTVQALRDSELRYSQLIDLLPTAVYSCDSQGKINMFNKAAVELWGRTPEIGKDLWCGSWKIYWADGTPMELDECPMAVALKEGRAVTDKEIIIERPDGNKRNVLPHPSPMFNSKGEMMEAVNMLIDITQLRNAEQAVRKSEKEFRQLADFVPQIVWTADANGYINYYNKQWYDYTGFKDAFGDESWLPILHPDDAERCHSTWYSSVRTGTSYQIEYRFKDRSKPGAYRWFLGRALPIKDDNGKIVKWFGTCTDINDQKLMLEKLGQIGEILEKKVAERTAELEEAQALAHIGSWEWDIQQNKIVFSKEQCRIYGLEETNNILSFDAFIKFRKGKHQDSIKKLIEDAVKNGSDFQYECTIIKTDGTERELFASGRVNTGSNHSDIKVLATTQDITERKRFETELIEKNTELERSNSDLENFAYVASHDLKEPLRMVSSYVQLIEMRLPQENLDKELAEYMRFVQQGAWRMQRLIDDLLRYSRIGRSEPLHFSPVNTQETVASVCRYLDNKIGETNTLIEYKGLPTVLGMRSPLSQLFQNLIENAIKFRRDDTPVIRISAKEWGDKYVFSVSDNGIGIHEDYYRRIFQIFQRLHTSDKYPGTGIGLSICKKIVEYHSGEIWLESELGKGSTFYFTLKKA